MPGTQIFRLEKRLSVGGGLGKHIDGLTRPDTAATREGLPAVELLDEHGKVITREDAERRRREAAEYLDQCRKVKSRGPKPKGCAEFIVAGLSWDDPIERHRELMGAAARHILKCGGRGVRIAHMALHLDEAQPHGHILVVVADERGRLGWNRVRKGFGMTGSESGRALMGALQERYHREVGSKFSLARGEPGSTAEHEPIDRVAGVKERLEEERQRGHADGEAAGREAAATEHGGKLEEVRRQHQTALAGVRKELEDVKKDRDKEAAHRRRLAGLQKNVLHKLISDLAGAAVGQALLSKVFNNAGYRIEFNPADGYLWRYDAKLPTATPVRPAPAQTPQPTQDRGTGFSR